MKLLWNLLPLLAVVALVCWGLWRWLKASDEPLMLVIRWMITAVVLGFVFTLAVRARDEISKIAAILVGAVGGLILTIVWRQTFCDFVGDQFASFYTGGKQEVEPTPLYSIAQGKRKFGKYQEAIEEVRKQLAQFPTDFTGWMLLAEIQAEDLNDLAAAQETINEILSHEDRAPKNIAFALNREADWHLKRRQDREAARVALERIVELIPDTEQAQMALQRIAHLTPAEMLEARQEPQRIALRTGEANIGLRREPLQIAPTEEDPATAAANWVKHLEAFPYDNEAREKLALIYARHYQRLDLASDQLEQLITAPNQPQRQVAHWLNLLADLQIEAQGDVAAGRETLQRIVSLYPKSAVAENALNRIAYLKLELRPKQQSQAIKLGSYEQNIGLKRGTFGPPPAGENPSTSSG
ncbi:MAG: hypothetical protein U1G07_04050 [Verrucomicrobiota bacterium]